MGDQVFRYTWAIVVDFNTQTPAATKPCMNQYRRGGAIFGGLFGIFNQVNDGLL